jgi:hypothetical protein
MKMEVIAGIASVSQLVAYSISCSRYLDQLNMALKNSQSTYRSEETNVNMLLDVIRRLPTEKILESDPVLRILIDISGLACEVLYLLEPKGFWISWSLITLQSKLIAGFEALNKKGNLLHLYITQTISTAIHTNFEDTRLSQKLNMASQQKLGKVSLAARSSMSEAVISANKSS